MVECLLRMYKALGLSLSTEEGKKKKQPISQPGMGAHACYCSPDTVRQKDGV